MRQFILSGRLAGQPKGLHCLLRANAVVQVWRGVL
jgi:hypothetical protein